MKNILPALCALISLVFTSSLASAASSYYVDKDSTRTSCSDANTGTLEKPFCTIQKAIQSAVPGTTINIMKGAYKAVRISSLNGADGAPITLKRYEEDRVVLDGQKQDVTGLDIIDSSYIVVDGVEVINSYGGWESGVRILRGHHNQIINCKVYDNLGSHTSGIIISGSHDNIIDNNEISNNYEAGIWIDGVAGASYNNVISNNTVYGNLLAQGDADGIGLTGPNTYNNQIIANIVYNNGDDGIDTFTSTGNLVKNNISHDHVNPNGDGNGFKLGGYKDNALGGGNTIIGNLSYNNRYNGFDNNGNPGNKYYFNIAFQNKNFGFENGWEETACTKNCTTEYLNNIGLDNIRANFNVGAYQTVSHNNIWFDSATGKPKVSVNYSTVSSLESFSDATGGLDNPNNGPLSSICANPMFVNADQADFHILSGSPAIDKGVVVADITDDHDGAIRPQGNGYDIGAFELSTSDTKTPILAEVTPIPYPTSDSTPNYVFSSDESGSITYGGSCSSSTKNAATGENTITLNALSEGIYGDCTISVTDAANNVSKTLNMTAFKITNISTPPAINDTTPPTLAEVAPIPYPTSDSTPNYVFSSDESGSITYGGSCSSSTKNAATGENTITLNALSEGIYGDCTISVTDATNNVSKTLNMTAFKITNINTSALEKELTDSVPDQFSFIDVTNATRDTTYISNPITVTGISTAVTISITGGEYRINGSSWTNSSSIVNEGDIVEVKVQSHRKKKRTVSTTLDIHGIKDTYSVKT
ncbi:MAG: right-handed parallel beta-helix repeat-containing protein [Candidatus Electrothrix sp. GW3-4]|uniref:right-handed parallel beta-helix repeat-containing protein n=1 Tax=Candidatus Electrothrix sp. GW3-4 TaxID=3126740 RepID=UPI0030CE40CA